MQYRAEIIPSYKINKEKWNACIEQNINGLVYATTTYLDYMTDNWTGVVLNDYEAVMPVPWRKKLGIVYSYDVPFVQQMGLVSGQNIKVDENILQLLFNVARYGNYSFNFNNHLTTDAVTCCNYILPLTSDYRHISSSFSKDVVQNIRKSGDNGLTYVTCTVEEAISLYKNLYQQRTPHVTEKDYHQFELMCTELLQKEQAVIRKVTAETGETLSAVLLLKDKRRLYNIMNSTTAKGRELEANYFLLSEVWKEFENSQLLFDFEGSDLPGVKIFYEKFGAVNQPYQKIKFNHLPSTIRWLKR